ncbi:hypothetical protein ScPMuIL_017571 [Solemya velum]
MRSSSSVRWSVESEGAKGIVGTSDTARQKVLDGPWTAGPKSSAQPRKVVNGKFVLLLPEKDIRGAIAGRLSIILMRPASKKAKGQPMDGASSFIVWNLTILTSRILDISSLNIIGCGGGNMSLSLSENFDNVATVCRFCSLIYYPDSHVTRATPCLQMVCEQCIEHIKDKGSYSCPHCKTEHMFENDRKVSPRDTPRTKVKQGNRLLKIHCRDCPDNGHAVEYCKDCCVFMCNDCTKAHRRSYASRTHALTSIQNLQGGSNIQSKTPMCTKHEGQPLVGYCSKRGCDVFVCTVCIARNHREVKGHILQNMNIMLEKRISDLEAIASKLERESTFAKNTLEKIDQIIRQYNAIESDMVGDIDSTFSECRRILDQRQREIRSSVHDICEYQKASLEKQTGHIRGFIDGMGETYESIQTLMKFVQPDDLLQLMEKVDKQYQTVNINNNFPKNTSFERPYFDSRKLKAEFRRLVEKMGQLNRIELISPLPSSPTLVERKPGSGEKPNQYPAGRPAEYVPVPTPLRLGKRQGSLRKITRHKDGEDRSYGRILCPFFKFDMLTCHKDIKVTRQGKLLTHYKPSEYKIRHVHGDKRLQFYRGAMSTRALKHPGQYYFEIVVTHQATNILPQCSEELFEIGICKRSYIDLGQCIGAHSCGWSTSLRYSEKLSHFEAYQPYHIFSHDGCTIHQLPLSTSGDSQSGLKLYLGLYLDTVRNQLVILDCQRRTVLYTFNDIDVSEQLWPVFGCSCTHHEHSFEMTLRSGKDITYIPDYLKSVLK